VKTKAPQEAATAPREASRTPLAAVLLVCCTVVAYWPALQGGLLWDDAAHVTRPGLRSLDGLWRIWFELGATQQYYPLLHSAFWIEHRLWGDAMLGYHLTNVFLHAAAAFLVMLIMRRLGLAGALPAALVFALHPVCVESVAWVSEQKNTLSAVFGLSAVLLYLSFDQSRRRSQYFLASALFVMALLSKTVTATLPAILLVVLWWRQGRLDWKRHVRPLLPWFALGAAAGLLTAWVERKFIGAEGPEFALTLVERFLVAGRAVWFYLGKLVWPADLMFFYPRWHVTSAEWWQYLYPLGAAAALAALCLLARKRRGPLAGALIFGGALFPALGFFSAYPFVYSYVADHFQYVASLGIIVPVVSGLASLVRPGTRRLAAVGACAVLAALGALTWQQCGMYRDIETLFQETLKRNPECWAAHYNLGVLIAETPGRTEEAIQHYREATRLKPDYAMAHYNLALALSQTPDRLPEAIAEYRAALRIDPNDARAHNNLGLALSKLPGQMPEAIAEYQAALRIDPDSAEAHNNLGIALLLTPGRGSEAIPHFQAALRVKPDSAEIHNNLGSAFSLAPGRIEEAIEEYRIALRLQPDYPDASYNLDMALAKSRRPLKPASGRPAARTGSPARTP
jgi:tetratricopeptide (TPR) repeat protein